jgi:CubicO group peptidase (beta-lactamase class C family)
MPSPFADAADILRAGVADRAFPGAAIEVGGRQGALWQRSVGALTYTPLAMPVTSATVFDLASLTKVIATTSLVMRAVDDGRLATEDLVSRWIPEWRGEDRADVTIADLLAHQSGLTAYMPFYRDFTGRIEFQHAICELPLEYAPRTASIYSDLGFMLLGFILEDAQPSGRGFAGAPGAVDPARRLEAQFRRLAAFITPEALTFNPPRAWRGHTAPTEEDSWRGRLLAGEVHDENAWALGGAAGHAGLFGTAKAVGAFARAVLGSLAGEPILARPDTMRRFTERTGIPGSSRALGWDTMLPTSTCGTLISTTAIGHTGFTGTSLWFDWERDLYIALLTNRVHPSRDNNGLTGVRRRVHDAVVEAFDNHFR